MSVVLLELFVTLSSISVGIAEEEEEDGNVQPGPQEENQSAEAADGAGDVQGTSTINSKRTGIISPLKTSFTEAHGCWH